MHFVPWKTIDLDGAFRITAPDSISEEVIQEVSNGITFKFNGKLEKTKLEILLTAPFELEETLHPTERENPPIKFICRLISRSTGRREIIESSKFQIKMDFNESCSYFFRTSTFLAADL